MTITFSYLSFIFLDVILFLTIVPTIYLILNDELLRLVNIHIFAATKFYMLTNIHILCY
jgi:hypothetical protein